jgi:hypothetical protein
MVEMEVCGSGVTILVQIGGTEKGCPSPQRVFIMPDQGRKYD